MKYLKTYEESKPPECGDYVLAEKKDFNNEVLQKLYRNNIGIISYIHNHKEIIYGVKYLQENQINKQIIGIPDEIIRVDKNWHNPGFVDPVNGEIQQFTIDEIKHYSKNKKDIEDILIEQKYGL